MLKISKTQALITEKVKQQQNVLPSLLKFLIIFSNFSSMKFFLQRRQKSLATLLILYASFPFSKSNHWQLFRQKGVPDYKLTWESELFWAVLETDLF